MKNVESVQTGPVTDIKAGVDLAPEPFDLCQTGHSGLHVATVTVFFVNRGKLFIVLFHVGSRSHHAHLTHENIQKLGKLIDAGLPDKAPPFENPVIIRRDLLHLVTVFDIQAPKLIHLELVTVPANPFLLE